MNTPYEQERLDLAITILYTKTVSYRKITKKELLAAVDNNQQRVNQFMQLAKDTVSSKLEKEIQYHHDTYNFSGSKTYSGRTLQRKQNLYKRVNGKEFTPEYNCYP